MDTAGQIFQISKFPDIISFVIIPGMFGEVSGKSVKSINPINLLKVVVFLPKSIEILAHKGSQTTRATPRDNLAS